jgi:hypothetical protein
LPGSSTPRLIYRNPIPVTQRNAFMFCNLSDHLLCIITTHLNQGSQQRGSLGLKQHSWMAQPWACPACPDTDRGTQRSIAIHKGGSCAPTNGWALHNP